MFKRRNRMLIGVPCGLQVLAMGLCLQNWGTGDERKDEAQAAERQQMFAIEAGVPAQRRRIDYFIAQVAAYPDFDATADGLNDRVSKGFDIVFDVGLHTQDSAPELQFAQVLADRRVARLYGYLTEMPPADAAWRAAHLVDAKLTIHDTALQDAIEEWRMRFAPAKPGMLYMLNPNLRYSYHALSAALFLSAAFCDVEAALLSVDRATSRLGLTVARVEFDPELQVLLGETKRHARQQNLFLLNVYVFMLERHTGLTARDVE